MAQGEPAVSVVIPAYNAERFLLETLDSVRGQSYRDYEIVLVDDGSSDNTASIAKEFGELRYCYQPNRGPAAARNAGLRMARGKYLAFLDADDLWHRDMLSACVGRLDGMPVISAVHTNWRFVDERGDLLPEASGWEAWRGDIFSRLLVKIALINGAIVWRRQCFAEIGGFDESPEVNDDWLNWLRIAHRGHLFDCLEEPLAFYRRHEDNLTTRESYRVIEWRKRALDILFAEIEVEPELERAAYAQVQWVKSVAALREADIVTAQMAFRAAVQQDDKLLESAETYYAIACANNGNPSEGTVEVVRAVANVELMLSGLDLAQGGEYTVARQMAEIRGTANFFLAQIAYGSARRSSPSSRSLLWQAMRSYPMQFAKPARAKWAARILVGKKRLQSRAG